MLNRRVVITGIGLVSSLGIGTSATWAALLAGTSGVTRVTRFDVTGYAAQIAAEVKGFDPLQFDREEGRQEDGRLHPVRHRRVAVRDGRLGAARSRRRTRPTSASFIGSGHRRVQHHRARARGAARGRPAEDLAVLHPVGDHQPRVRPGVDPVRRQGAEPGDVHRLLGVGARHRRVVRDHQARRRRRDDRRRLGGGDHADERRRLRARCARCRRATTTRARASRPFDKDRDGFIIGEGAGMLILEELEHATRRGAPIYAELVGYGMSADAYHITAPSEDGDGGVRVMRMAIRKAGIRPDQVDYINAHGTSTPYNDKLETLAIKTLLRRARAEAGDLVDQVDDRPPARRRRRPRGRHLGAGRATTRCVPPTINLDNPDPECDLDYVPHKSRPMPITLRAVELVRLRRHQRCAAVQEVRGVSDVYESRARHSVKATARARPKRFASKPCVSSWSSTLR